MVIRVQQEEANIFQLLLSKMSLQHESCTKRLHEMFQFSTGRLVLWPQQEPLNILHWARCLSCTCSFHMNWFCFLPFAPERFSQGKDISSACTCIKTQRAREKISSFLKRWQQARLNHPTSQVSSSVADWFVRSLSQLPFISWDRLDGTKFLSGAAFTISALSFSTITGHQTLQEEY